MTRRVMVRQGDVLIVSVKAVPETAKQETAEERIILAHGELTGHHHSIVQELDSPAVTVWSDGEEDRFLNVLRECSLFHQEHSTITIPPGTYRVVRQREYRAPDISRQVAD